MHLRHFVCVRKFYKQLMGKLDNGQGNGEARAGFACMFYKSMLKICQCIIATLCTPSSADAAFISIYLKWRVTHIHTHILIHHTHTHSLACPLKLQFIHSAQFLTLIRPVGVHWASELELQTLCNAQRTRRRSYSLTLPPPPPPPCNPPHS